MEEREFFNETTELRNHTLTCPKCGQAGEYKVSWVVRRKRPQLPRNADERDRARFAKAQSYMVRRDDKLSCANVRCRKPFEITSLLILVATIGIIVLCKQDDRPRPHRGEEITREAPPKRIEPEAALRN